MRRMSSLRLRTAACVRCLGGRGGPRGLARPGADDLLYLLFILVAVFGTVRLPFRVVLHALFAELLDVVEAADSSRRVVTVSFILPASGGTQAMLEFSTASS